MDQEASSLSLSWCVHVICSRLGSCLFWRKKCRWTDPLPKGEHSTVTFVLWGGCSLSQSRTEPSHVHLWTRIGVAPSPSSSSIVGLGQLGHRRSRRRGLLVISQQQSEQESRTSLVCVYFGWKSLAKWSHLSMSQSTVSRSVVVRCSCAVCDECWVA